MSSKPPHAIIRKFYAVLGILIIAVLLYQNFTLYSISKSLRRSQLRIPPTELTEVYTNDEISAAVAALVAENMTYKNNLRRQGKNLKDCMAKLSPEEVDAFYQAHRDELQLEYDKLK